MDPAAAQDPADPRGADAMAEFEQLALDPAVSPARVLPRHPLIAAAILQSTGSSTWISIYIVGCCVVSMIALLLMPRRDPTYEAPSVRAPAAAGS